MINDKSTIISFPESVQTEISTVNVLFFPESTVCSNFTNPSPDFILYYFIHSEPETDDCPNKKVYYNCRGPQGVGPSGVGVACEVTCRNLMLNLTCPPMTPCVSGCGCPAG